MSSRNGLRRKIVLPVTVVRSKLGQSQLAHTVDLSDTSARLGGLTMLLEPGEVVEIQREGTTARFQVFWMGSVGTAMEGQAGIRSLEPEKSIWGLGPKEDGAEGIAGSEIDVPVSLPEASAPLPGDKRWHSRLECTGSAAVLSLGSKFPVHGAIKDVSRGGIYVEVTTALAVKSKVTFQLNIEGIALEGKGVVRTSYPMVGMGISFQSLSPENEENLARVLEKVSNRKPAGQPAAIPAEAAKPAIPSVDSQSARMLIKACQALTADFEKWKSAHSPVEMEELRRAVNGLYLKLSAKSESGPQEELVDYLSINPGGGAA
jgi:hypothetical protein